MKTICYILVLPFMLLCWETMAQEQVTPTENEVIIQLKSGSKIYGEIIDWVPGEYITFLASWGKEVTLEASQIRKVTQVKAEHLTIPAVYNFSETGRYITIKGQYIADNAGQRAASTPGAGLSVSAGHKFNRYLAVGGGVAYDKFIWESGENIVPVFGEIMGFLGQKNTSVMYNLQVGYGFAFENEEYLLTEASGGIHIHPAIGLRFGNNPNVKYCVDVGYKFQDASYTYENPWSFGWRSEQNIFYKRLTLRFGLLL